MQGSSAILFAPEPTKHASAAKARGVKTGEKPKLTAHQQAEATKRGHKGETLVEIQPHDDIGPRVIPCPIMSLPAKQPKEDLNGVSTPH